MLGLLDCQKSTNAGIVSTSPCRQVAGKFLRCIVLFKSTPRFNRRNHEHLCSNCLLERRQHPYSAAGFGWYRPNPLLSGFELQGLILLNLLPFTFSYFLHFCVWTSLFALVPVLHDIAPGQLTSLWHLPERCTNPLLLCCRILWHDVVPDSSGASEIALCLPQPEMYPAVSGVLRVRYPLEIDFGADC